MPAPINPFKKALADGEIQFGCWLGIPTGFTTELMGHAGFDWLVIDGEHGPQDYRATLNALQVLAGTPAHPVVRVPVGDTVIIKQMLDLGAQTLLVPMVESAAQAEQLVRDVTYPPHGVRGVGFALSRAAGFSTIADYGKTADAQICLLVQVENRAGLAALDEILAVEGVHGVFIGPSDLAADMGHMSNPEHPDVQAAIMDAITRIRAAGKAPGILSTRDPMTNAALEAGAQFVAVGADVLLLGTAARGLAAKWQATRG
ncbi:HpcH/HpaI aldolase/citrate lyase family protein [Sulfitobacter albidus]|uniref:Hydroxypyruvate/pyruvate aldolase n=1 Tax=Sulfitobacter albidus TaxID=2829501 RepID=A0A975PMP0_9RHOB|nr:HpcH/HpaI aldolase/citrate lyase family protein [Sulfitobacter albidus]QUJ76445.1 HpcH/HpaI aldolase/citrate lyase family protein [Sulfitobacter albidus]